jgi:hypothetical protein
MTKRIISSDKLAEAIELRIIKSADKGLTVDAIMSGFKIGRACVRNNLKFLEEAGRIHRVKHTKSKNRFAPPTTFHTYHAGSGKPSPAGPARRDWLVEAFFGPARREAA